MAAGLLCCVFYCVVTTSLGLLGPMKDSNGETNVDVVADHVTLIEEKLQDLTNRYQTTVTQLAALKNHQSGGTQGVLAKEILFEVQLQKNLTGINDNDALVFDDIVYNTGGGYTQTTGKFTAPVPGSYLFWCYGVVNDNDRLQIELYVNGKQGAAGYAPHHRQYRVAAVTTLFQLKQGDQVWMTKIGSASLMGSGLSSFGGVLLYPH